MIFHNQCGKNIFFLFERQSGLWFLFVQIVFGESVEPLRFTGERYAWEGYRVFIRESLNVCRGAILHRYNTFWSDLQILR